MDWFDFLDRPDFTPEPDCDNAVSQKTVLVSGAGGSIGSALAGKLMGSSAGKLLLLDRSEHRLDTLYRNYRNRKFTGPAVEFLQTDILAGPELEQIFLQYRPNI